MQNLRDIGIMQVFCSFKNIDKMQVLMYYILSVKLMIMGQSLTKRRRNRYGIDIFRL